MIAPGTRLGSFELLSILGAGGMGEVYRAVDARLGREVALKALPEAFSSNPARLARFEREARILASLSHPAIASIHGIEESGGVRFLILELVPGDTLSARLKLGPLPLAEALSVCRQVAEALEAAHAKGVVHRDLKPANIKITPDGKVKVLDFGLAKDLGGDGSVTDPDVSTDPHHLTLAGAVLGTAAYMSPEQARGQELDVRTDIWSFGCVLYESLTGRPAFGAPTFSDSIAAVLGSDPDWNALPQASPEVVRGLLRRCLERDRQHRLHHIADARIEIEEALAGSTAGRARRWAPRLPSLRSAMLGLAALACVTGLIAWSRRAPDPPRPRAGRRLNVNLPRGVELGDASSGTQTTLALSPDGSRLVFAAGPTARRHLYLRSFDQLEAIPIPGTDGGDNPFFSPDGRWLGFAANGQLKRIPVEGGEPALVCDAPNVRGASWGRDGTILFAPSTGSGLSRVPATGGAPQVVTTPVAGKELSHRWPHILPDGKAALFSIMTSSGREEERQIAVLSLDTGEWRTIALGASYPRYAPRAGLLFWGQGGHIHAASFDPERRRLTGPAAPVLQGVQMWLRTSGHAYFDVADDGTAVFVPGPPRSNRALWWVDRQGHQEPLRQPPRPYTEPALSPDGRRLAVVVEGDHNDIWIYEIDRALWTRATLGGDNNNPVWSHDSTHLFFGSNRNGALNIYVVPADGSATAVRLTHSANWQFPTSCSGDGKYLAFTEQTASTAQDLWVLPLGGDREPRPVLVTQAAEMASALSPDGRWLAYASNESGRDEVYVRPFPGPGRKWPVSREGGRHPLWDHSRNELFYQNAGKTMAVTWKADPDFTTGAPRVLFESEFVGGDAVANYTASPDGRRFVMIEALPEATVRPQIVVIPDLFEELRTRAR